MGEGWKGEEMKWSDVELRATGSQIMVSMFRWAIDSTFSTLPP